MPTCCFYICHIEKSKQIHFLPCGVIRFNFGGFGIVLADFLGAYPFACCDCSIASCVWSKANFSKYARYSIFLPAASYDNAMCAYDSNFGWDCVCDTKVSVWKDESGKCCWKNSQGIITIYKLGVWICWSMRLFLKEIIIPYHVTFS